jgi:hypothetical protein
MSGRARQRAAMEHALRRRRGASASHARKVQDNMLSKDDLFTTCQTCGEQIRGTLDAIKRHCEGCGDE